MPPVQPGMRPPETQGIVIQARFDWEARETHKVSSERTMYTATDEAGVWSIRRGEFAFTVPGRKSNIRDVVPKALTQLNGKGAEALQMFPNDEVNQVNYLSNRIQVIGVAEDDIFDVKSSSASSFLVKIAGPRSILARGSLKFGDYIQAVPPKPSQLDNLSQLEGVPYLKVTLIPRAYTPLTVAETIGTYIRLFLRSEERMLSLNDMRFSRTPLHVALKTMFSNQLFIGCITLYKFLKLGIIQWNDLGNVNFNLKLQGQQPTHEDLIIAMMQNFDLFPRQNFTPPGTNVRQDIKSNYTELGITLLNMFNWDGRVANFGFGFDDKSNRLEGKTETGEIITSNSRGAVLNLQLNLPKSNYAATSQFIMKEYDSLQGKLVSSAEDGEYATMI